MALMGYREFARHLNVSLGAVQKAIKSGRIIANADGKIDSDTATAAWIANSDESRKSLTDLSRVSAVNGNAVDGPDSTSLDGEGEEDGDGEPIDIEPPAIPAALADPNLQDYRRARAGREQTRHEREQLELAQLKGSLIDVREAQRLAFTALRTVRDNLLNIPVRVRDQLAAETDPARIEETLHTELAAALSAVTADAILQDQNEVITDGGE